MYVFHYSYLQFGPVIFQVFSGHMQLEVAIVSNAAIYLATTDMGHLRSNKHIRQGWHKTDCGSRLSTETLLLSERSCCCSLVVVGTRLVPRFQDEAGQTPESTHLACLQPSSATEKNAQSVTDLLRPKKLILYFLSALLFL